MAKATKVKDTVKGSNKGYFSQENVENGLHWITSFRPSLTRATVFELLALALILSIAAIVRLLPLRWGFYLTEFDPYWQYHQTQYVVQNGFQAWFGWHDTTVWFPWGRDVAASSYPGIPFSAAALYMVLTTIGLNVTVFDVCVIWPVLLGVSTCLLLYVLGKDLGGRGVGLFSALFLALSSATIARTSLGFFDDETLSVFLVILVALFFIRSLESRRSIYGTMIYGVLAGLSVGYLQATSGLSVYIPSLLALLAIVLILFRKYSRKLLVSYNITLGVAYLIAIQVPRIGVGFLTQTTTLASIGVALILCMMEFSSIIKTQRMKILTFILFFLAIGGSYFVLQSLGLVSPIVAKFIAVIDPFARFTQPILESVAEQQPATWSSFYYDVGAILFVAPLGFYFLMRRGSSKDLYIVLWGITALYFASTFVRLQLILAPVLALLGAVAVVELIKPFINIAREKVIFTRKTRFTHKVGKEFGAVFVILMLLVVFPPLSRAINSSYVPATIATSSLPVRPTSSQSFDDWIQALSYMRDNLPKDAVVAAWWDYGYWISILGNRTSLADNGTINSTQIADIGRMFLSNTTQSLKLMKEHGVTYVVTFIVWGSTSTSSGGTDIKFYGFGDEGKWRWMARIADLNETVLEETTKDSSGNSYGVPNANTTLGKLIWYGIGGSPVSTYSQPTNFSIIFSSTNRWVTIFKVNYNATS